MQNQNFPVSTKRGKDATISSHQKTFNRLIKKVQDLQSQREKMEHELDEALQFYHSTVRPDEMILLQHLAERLTVAYEFYKTTKDFSKKELAIFKEWLKENVNKICSMYCPSEIPDTVKEIFKAVYDVGYNESLAQESEEAKKELQEKLKGIFGEGIDLSDVDMMGSQEDILRDICMKMGETVKDLKEKFSQTPKTKKQLEKEAKKQAVEELQGKSVQSIYKQLARVLHPDLEQDIEKRVLKEESMKKLTVAYENKDLYSLLKIETEWMNHSVDKMKCHSDDDIKVYNAILKDQVSELESANEMLIMHPRYISLQKFYGNRFSGIVMLQLQYNRLKQFIQDVQAMVARLKTSEAKALFKVVIQERTRMVKSMCTCGSC
ncbi:MAG TPA: hypothetical protein VGW78_02870 [Candidatus Babeliales bacterium]|nr:hypothetical protein [Candidatus Babeliales bacterium]